MKYGDRIDRTIMTYKMRDKIIEQHHIVRSKLQEIVNVSVLDGFMEIAYNLDDVIEILAADFITTQVDSKLTHF